MAKVFVTGANGNIGKKLLMRLCSDDQWEVVAAVRSEEAATSLQALGLSIEIVVVDYRDAEGISYAAAGCDAVIHLVGIIKESGVNTFQKAHEDAVQAIVDANLPATRVLALGIIGADEHSANACLRSRWDAEQILLEGRIPATIIRVPMVIGDGDYASRALAKKSRARVVFAFRAESMEQPIACIDVIEALVRALQLPAERRVLELAGPESLSRAALIRRAADILHKRPLIVSLPLWLGQLLAFVLENLLTNPPITQAMLGVLDHDDCIDTQEAQLILGVALTPLDEVLSATIKSSVH